MNKKKKILFIIGGAFILFGIMIGLFILNIKNQSDSIIKNLVMNPITLETVPDGSYTGSYSITPVEVEVVVTVQNHQIISIELVKHNNGLGSKAENIINSVIQEQSLDVDVISGATVSSTTILKAIEVALEGK